MKEAWLGEWRANAERWKAAAAAWRLPGVEVYHPAVYAERPYADFIAKFPPKKGCLLTLGLNPGPYGMAQTGIPFTDCRTADKRLGLPMKVPGYAPEALARRLVTERKRSTYERSSIGIYKFLDLAWGDLRAAYADWVAINACPLLFLESGPWKNLTPADGRIKRLADVQPLRETALRRAVETLAPRGVVCLGRDVEACLGPLAVGLLGETKVVVYPHPARAVPEAWAKGLRDELVRRNLL